MAVNHTAKRTAAQPPNLELHISHLILPVGIDHRQQTQISAAIEHALGTLIAEHGLPPGRDPGALNLDSTSIEISAGSSPQIIAAQIAQSIYTQLNSPAAPPSPHLSPARSYPKSAK